MEWILKHEPILGDIERQDNKTFEYKQPLENVSFAFDENPVLFKIYANGYTGRMEIVDKDNGSGKIVFMYGKHKNKFQSGKQYKCSGYLLSSIKKKFELFVPTKIEEIKND